MLRFLPAVLLILSIGAGPFARADELPIIVTYELKKQRRETRANARNPKGFWIHQVAARIETKAAELPTPLKEPVTVRVTFVVGRDGRLVSKAIEAPSGTEAADKAVLAMLDRAQPFPPMPAAMTDAELSFTLPIRFR